MSNINATKILNLLNSFRKQDYIGAKVKYRQDAMKYHPDSCKLEKAECTEEFKKAQEKWSAAKLENTPLISEEGDAAIKAFTGVVRPYFTSLTDKAFQELKLVLVKNKQFLINLNEAYKAILSDIENDKDISEIEISFQKMFDLIKNQVGVTEKSKSVEKLLENFFESQFDAFSIKYKGELGRFMEPFQSLKEVLGDKVALDAAMLSMLDVFVDELLTDKGNVLVPFAKVACTGVTAVKFVIKYVAPIMIVSNDRSEFDFKDVKEVLGIIKVISESTCEKINAFDSDYKMSDEIATGDGGMFSLANLFKFFQDPLALFNNLESVSMPPPTKTELAALKGVIAVLDVSETQVICPKGYTECFTNKLEPTSVAVGFTCKTLSELESEGSIESFQIEIAGQLGLDPNIAPICSPAEAHTEL